MLKKIRIPGNIRYTIAVVGILLVLNFLLRVGFLFYNTAQARAMDWSEILMAFVVGLRFDLATIFLFNGFLFLILVSPLNINRRLLTYRIANWIILLVNIPILLVNGIDIVYFGFAEKRLTHELYTTKGGDMLNFNFDVLKEWWYLILTFLLIAVGLGLILKRLSRRNLERVQERGFSPKGRNWALAGVCAMVMFLGARGGIQRQPLNTAMAFVRENLFVGKAGLNSAYTIISSVGFSREEPMAFLPTKEAVATTRQMIKNDFDGPFVSNEYPFVRQARFDGPEKKRNVVILIIESFNAAQVGCLNGVPDGKSLTPNFDTLANHGLLCTNYYSNASRSVESLPAILNSLPDIFRRPAISTPYLHDTHWGIGNILQNRGYETAFFCGGPNGTLGFDAYSKVCGMSKYYGKDEYPHAERDYDGLWGCFDDPFLEWTGQMQNKMDKPFLSVWFSISNHHPFRLPDVGAEEFKDLDATDMEKTHAYTDKALGNYFAQVQQYDWYDSTYFIITGDHCFHEMSNPDYNVMDYFHVPFLMIGPDICPEVRTTPTNHLNVFPTLIELLQLNTYHGSMGVSLFSQQNHPFVIHNQMGVLTLAEDDHAYTTNFRQFTQQFELVDEKEWEEQNGNADIYAKLDHRLKSIFQTAHNARVAERLMGEEWMK